MSQERSLLLGCFLQLFYIIASFLTVGHFSRPLSRLGIDFSVVDNRPRRPPQALHFQRLGNVSRPSLGSNLRRHKHPRLQYRSRSFRLRLRSLLHLGLDGNSLYLPARDPSSQNSCQGRLSCRSCGFPWKLFSRRDHAPCSEEHRV